MKIKAGGQAIELKFKGEVREVKYRLAADVKGIADQAKEEDKKPKPE